MSVTRRKFGKTKDGEPVTLYTITNKMGNSVSIMDYGATVQSINIVDAEGEVIDCCLGYNTVAEYEEHTDFMGLYRPRGQPHRRKQFFSEWPDLYTGSQ